MRRVTISASFGTVIEWYDFFLYGTASALIFPDLFFPQSSSATSTLLAFGTYATGFAARPVGGIIAGHYGDRIGRRTVMVVTLSVMGLSTAGIGLLPTYDQVGSAAPLMLVGLRIVQGLATGGEWGGAALLTSEHAKNRPGYYGSFITSGVFVGLVLGSVTFIVLDKVFDDDLLAGAWRIPFLMSIVLVAIGIYIRSQVAETPEFEALKEQGSRERLPIAQAIRHPRPICAIFLMRIGQNTSFYIISVFALAYATDHAGLTKSEILAALLVGSSLAAILCPVYGALGDRYGFRPIMLIALVVQVFFAIPFFLLIDTGHVAAGILAVTIGVAGSSAASDAIQPAYFPSMFGANIRFTGVSLGREGGTVIGGGLAPLIATALLNWSGSPYAVAGWMILTSLAGLGGVLLVGSGRPAPARGPSVKSDGPAERLPDHRDRIVLKGR